MADSLQVGGEHFMHSSADYAAAFRRDGYFICENILALDVVEGLRTAVSDIPDGVEVRRKRSVYGVRNLLEVCPAVCGLSQRCEVRRFATDILGDGAFAVRAVFFDKSADANWSLFWHQDNVVSVSERRDAPGFVGWSQKAGVWQVQPPAEVLADMVAVRVHLDDSSPHNGPLRVLPGSHRCGWIEDLDAWKARVEEVTCTVGCGGVVAMCPLTLHASSESVSTARRRVIQIEYAAAELPGGLQWRNRIGASLDRPPLPKSFT